MLHMTDHRLHRRAALPPSLQGCRDQFPVAVRYEDLAVAFIIVAPVAKIDSGLERLGSRYLGNLGESLFEGMPVIGIAMKRQRSNRPVLFGRGGDPHLAPELISLVYLALADAFHIWFMNRVQLVLVVLALGKQPGGEIQESPQLGVNDARFSLDVPGNPAQVRLQDPCLSPGTLELLGMRIAALLPKGILARAGVRLP